MSTAGPDPQLTADHCTFLEVVKDDGGVNKGSNPAWWTSWDFTLTDSNGNVVGDNPKDGNTYNVNVQFHLSTAQTCPDTGADMVNVEVYLCAPSLGVVPSAAARLGQRSITSLTDFHANPALTKSKVDTLQFPWTFKLGELVPGGPSVPLPDDGHRCLIARCFESPTVISEGASDFYVPDDPHYGQHNLFIAANTGGRRPGMQHFPIITTNPNREELVPATLRVVVDLNPSRHLIDILAPRFKQLDGFDRIASTALQKGFALQLPDFPDAKIRDTSHPEKGGYDNDHYPHLKDDDHYDDDNAQLKHNEHHSGHAPAFEADITLKPGQQTRFFFDADSSEDKVGTARVYHVTHLDAHRRVIGGLTLVTFAAPPVIS